MGVRWWVGLTLLGGAEGKLKKLSWCIQPPLVSLHCLCHPYLVRTSVFCFLRACVRGYLRAHSHAAPAVSVCWPWRVCARAYVCVCVYVHVHLRACTLSRVFVNVYGALHLHTPLGIVFPQMITSFLRT